VRRDATEDPGYCNYVIIMMIIIAIVDIVITIVAGVASVDWAPLLCLSVTIIQL